MTQNLGTSWNFSVKGFRRYGRLKLPFFQKTAKSAYSGYPAKTSPNFLVLALVMASPEVRLQKILAFRIFPRCLHTQKTKKMTKKYPKMTIFWHFFNFFLKLMILSSPKLPCINISFVQTYSQSYSY